MAMNLSKLGEMVKDREVWRAAVHVAFVLLLLGACMLRRWKGVCKEWVGSPVFQFASGLCSPVEHALSHPGHYSC